MGTIVVVDYDPNWPATFEHLRSQIWQAVSNVATAVEHVGSTSVPGLAAKPIIDMAIVVPSETEVPVGIQRLGTIGYAHGGNLGVEGREAFTTPNSSPRHHVYLCPASSPALANHLGVRNFLRCHPDVAHEYGALKKQLAVRFAEDIDGYTDGKTDMILRILRQAGFDADALEQIERINRWAV